MTNVPHVKSLLRTFKASQISAKGLQPSQVVGPGSCCRLQNTLAGINSKKRAACWDEPAWGTSAMNTELPKLKFSELARDFILTPPFNLVVWNQDLGDTTEDNVDLRWNQVKPWDAFFFSYKAVHGCCVFGFFLLKKSSYQFWSSLIMYHPLVSNHVHGWGWLRRHKEGKDSTYQYIIIYSLKAFILMQNKPGKIYIAICNKRSKPLMWY